MSKSWCTLVTASQLWSLHYGSTTSLPVNGLHSEIARSGIKTAITMLYESALKLRPETRRSTHQTTRVWYAYNIQTAMEQSLIDSF